MFEASKATPRHPTQLNETLLTGLYVVSPRNVHWEDVSIADAEPTRSLPDFAERNERDAAFPPEF